MKSLLIEQEKNPFKLNLCETSKQFPCLNVMNKKHSQKKKLNTLLLGGIQHFLQPKVLEFQLSMFQKFSLVTEELKKKNTLQGCKIQGH